MSWMKKSLLTLCNNHLSTFYIYTYTPSFCKITVQVRIDPSQSPFLIALLKQDFLVL